MRFAFSFYVATEGLEHMKTFCPKLKTLHNVIKNTACSEPLMEERQEKRNVIKTEKIGR